MRAKGVGAEFFAHGFGQVAQVPEASLPIRVARAIDDVDELFFRVDEESFGLVGQGAKLGRVRLPPVASIKRRWCDGVRRVTPLVLSKSLPGGPRQTSKVLS